MTDNLSHPFDVEIHWTDADHDTPQIAVKKVLARDWRIAVELAMRGERFDKSVPIGAVIMQIIPRCGSVTSQVAAPTIEEKPDPVPEPIKQPKRDQPKKRTPRIRVSETVSTFPSLPGL